MRLWDPRVGDKSIGKLIGHSDCVRSVVVSEDGRYVSTMLAHLSFTHSSQMLTGSSDTTIKSVHFVCEEYQAMELTQPARLWSLAAHRCLHTFNHHTSSVWALHSTHPNLERFYSGSRDGHLCVVDVEQVTDISDGECVVLAREGDAPKSGESESKSGDEGIRCIVAMDDEFVWSATGSADLKRWRDVGRRTSRLSNHDDGVSYEERPNGNVSIDVPSGLGGPFVPLPITNKRLTVDGGADGSAGTESSTRSVAFAPTSSPRNAQTQDVFGSPTSQTNSSPQAFAPGSLGSNGGLPAGFRDRLNLAQQRFTTSSGALIARSFRSESSANVEDGQVPAQSKTLNGLPYKSLVCLGLPDSPYSLGFAPSRQDPLLPDNPRGSIGSGPPGLSSLLKPDGADGAHRGSAILDRDQTQAQMARMEFEDREVASEATPLRSQADEVIAGRSGLVRSLLLNDRQHVLTVDTDGEVAAWNIIRGVCVGRFAATEVAAALHLERREKAGTAVRKHSQEVLELVKERVEGETMVITWCQVDTKIGSLVVHLEEGRVFDAEIYADQMGIEGMEEMKEDARSES